MSNEKAKETLTAEDRAHFVVNEVRELGKRTIGDWVAAITKQIQEAESAARAEGFADAQERAADIADDEIDRYAGETGHWHIGYHEGAVNCAGRIRSLKPQ